MPPDPDRLRAQLTLHEGRRVYPYMDTTGHLTVGVGHNLTGRGLPDTVIDLLLDEDIAGTWAILTASLPWIGQLDEVRQRVLMDMAFNLGVAGLLSFRQTLAAVQRGDFVAAARGMLDSKWARQVGPRADRLALMMATGDDSQDF